MGTQTQLHTHPTWIEFNRTALRRNVALIRKRIGSGVIIIASVKANAYGHGIVPSAKTLQEEGVEMLATGSFSDAIAMRKAGIEIPILMLAGTLPAGMGELISAKLIPTVYDLEGANAANTAASSYKGNQGVPIFIKVDCGMGRLGVNLENAVDLIQKIQKMENIWIQGIYTHLSFKDEEGMNFSKERFSIFYELLDTLEENGCHIPITQALASSALAMGWSDRCTAVCPGHLLYGLPSLEPTLATLEEFVPVCKSVKSRVIHVGEHGQGPKPGAGGYHKARRYSRTAVIPFGLHDGNRAHKLGKNSKILFKNRRLAILGVSLEHLVFEVHDDISIEVGDEVTIIGRESSEKIDMAEYATWQDSSPLEALLALSNRLPIIVAD